MPFHIWQLVKAAGKAIACFQFVTIMGNIGENRGTFGLPFLEDPTIPEWAQNIEKQIRWYGFGITSFIGFLLNCVVLWVWCCTSQYNPMVFLFKTLAAFDNAFIIFVNASWFFHMGSAAKLVFQAFAFWAQHMSIGITLVLTTCQWIAVFLPSRSKVLLSRPRITLAVATVVVFCTAVTFIESGLALCCSDRRLDTTGNVAIASLLQLLPTAIQMLLTASLILRVYSGRFRVAPESDDIERGTSRDGSYGRKDRTWGQKVYSKRSLTYTVISINIMTLLTYPAGTVLSVYLFAMPQAMQVGWKTVALTIVTLTQILNSAVNFFFYAFFLFSLQGVPMIKCIIPKCDCDCVGDSDDESIMTLTLFYNRSMRLFDMLRYIDSTARSNEGAPHVKASTSRPNLPHTHSGYKDWIIEEQSSSISDPLPNRMLTSSSTTSSDAVPQALGYLSSLHLKDPCASGYETRIMYVKPKSTCKLLLNRVPVSNSTSSSSGPPYHSASLNSLYVQDPCTSGHQAEIMHVQPRHGSTTPCRIQYLTPQEEPVDAHLDSGTRSGTQDSQPAAWPSVRNVQLIDFESSTDSVDRPEN